MTKKISYLIPRRFQWLFITLCGLAYITSDIPYIQMMLRPDAVFDSVANTTILIASLAMPLVVAAGAMLLTRRRGLGCYWAAAGIAFMATLINMLLMQIGSLIAPSYYEGVNIAALVLTVCIALGAAWLDGRSTRDLGRLRQWRLVAVAAVYGVMVALIVLSSVVERPAGDTWMDWLYLIAILVVPIAALAFVFRRFPVLERVKRVLLVITVLLAIGTVTSGSFAVAMIAQVEALAPLWTSIVALALGFVVSVWMLRPAAWSRALRA